MQAVILAAGKGTRMRELTVTTPKPLLKIAGKSLLEHKLDALPEKVTDVVILVGYLGDQIAKHLGAFYKGKKITYVYTDRTWGTGHGLWETRKHLREAFVVMMGDDIYSSRDISNCIEHPWAVLVEKSGASKKGAHVVVNETGRIVDIREGAELSPGMYNNAGLYVLSKEIFDYPLVKLQNGEYGLPQTIALAAGDFEIKTIEATSWHQISSPEDLKFVEEKLFGPESASMPLAA